MLPGAQQVRRLAAILRMAGLGLALSLAGTAPAATGFSEADDDAPKAGVEPPHFRPAEVLVRFRASAGSPGRARALAEVGLRAEALPRRRHDAASPSLQGGTPGFFQQLVRYQLHPETSVGEAVHRLRRHPEVVYAEPNYLLRLCVEPDPATSPDDFELPRQWNLENTGQLNGTPGADVSAPAAWAITRSARAVRVAVIDTGIDYFHPDLEANVWINAGEIPGNGEDDDGNGYIDDLHGFDFVSNDGDPMDDQTHGTHVAGTIGALGNNRIGVAGLCWEASLMAIKAFNERGEASVADVVEAIEYAVANGARLINASWGQPEQSLALLDAIRLADEAGVLVISASGNSRTDEPHYPAALEEVVSVGATNNKDERARFSNFGPTVDLAAPGEIVLSTAPNARYEYLSGTSMAAPHVTGVAALVLGLHPDFTNAELVNVLRNAVDETRVDKLIGTGRLNAFKAVRVTRPLPTARLQAPAVVSGVLTLAGTATAEAFAAYRVEVGEGLHPDTWTAVYEGTAPVVNGELVRDYRTDALHEGVHSFRLVVVDDTGQTAFDRVAATVRNVEISSPQHTDILRAGPVVELRGTVYGAGRHYRIEYGRGRLPSSWSTDGITLRDEGLNEVDEGVLGWWDTSRVPADEFYTLRLRAEVGGEVVGDWLTHLVHLDSRLRPGWPVFLPGDVSYSTNDWRDLRVADLDGDGLQEVVRVHPGTVTGDPAQLRVYGADGRLQWSAPLGGGEPYSDIPVMGDTDGDGRLELFAETGEDGLVWGFQHDGTPLAGDWPVTLTANQSGKVLADLDHDGQLELICYGQSPRRGHYRRQLAVFDRLGKRLADWAIDDCYRDVDAPRMFPAVGNFDRDPGLEIVAVNGCREVLIFDLEEPEGPVRTIPLDTTLHGTPAVGDVDQDGLNEIVIGGYDPKAGEASGIYGGVYLIGEDGVRPGWPVLIEQAFLATPALADFDHDGDLEIVLPSWQAKRLHVLHHDGFEAPGWPVVVSGYETLRSQPLIADIDGDGSLDVVATVNGQTIQLAMLGEYAALGGTRAWDFHGRRLDLDPNPGLTGVWLEQSGGFPRTKSPPAVLTDLDGNGRLDLVTSSIDDRGYFMTDPYSFSKGRYSLYAWELPAPHVASNMVWAAYQRGPQHTGYLASPARTNLPPAILEVPSQTIAVGGRFFPISLLQYVADPDHPITGITWRVEGTVELRATIEPGAVLRIETPGPAWAGAETLVLVAQDPEGAEARRPVVFAAVPGYQPPRAVADEFRLPEDTAIELDLLANDTHPLALPFRLASFSRPLAGALSRAADGRLLYAPQPDYFGPDAFTYLVADEEGGMALGEVQLTIEPVPDPPSPQDDHVITDEDTPVEIRFLENDTDPDGEPLAPVSIGRPLHGQVTAGNDPNTLRYVPEPDWSGEDGFDYRVADPGGNEVSARVALRVKPVNDAPRAEDQGLTLNRNDQRDVFYRASDPDGDTLEFEIVDGPTQGELWTFPQLATYFPAKGFFGADHFTYRASDGKLTSRLATVTFAVLDANNPPKTKSITLTNKVDRPVTVTLAASDRDEDPVQFEIAVPPDHGTLAGEGSDYVYTPNPGFVGWDVFHYRAGDGRDFSPDTPVSIYVTDRNTAPLAGEAEFEIRFNTPTGLRLPATDPESDPLTFTIVEAPAHGTVEAEGPPFTYRPEEDYVGSDRFTFTASDGELNSEPGSVFLRVQPSNRRPMAEDQSLTFPADVTSPVALAVHDPDADPLRVAILKGPRYGLLAGVGTNYVYRPNPGFAGADSFTYKAWDGHIYSNVGTVRFVVRTPSSDVPRIEAIKLPPEGGVWLQFFVRAGRTHELQISADLVEWEPLTTFASDVEKWTYHDTTAPPGHRFYRLVER
ncbi:MAG: tandem-95 repeat protein [Verrucomicrobiales bacterium]|nr:tandem-95 repeat protein [Verrucomicrobiales bacterium]